MKQVVEILLVEDSMADANLIQEVFREEKISANLNVARDGEEAMAYLHRQAEFSEARFPDLILLDLNLPKKDGREVLAEIKATQALKSIPVIILTTSQSEDDVMRSYNLQASCYVTKPMELEKFTALIKSIDSFWLSTVRFPPKYEFKK